MNSTGTKRIRQFAHQMRNHLNGLVMEISYLEERSSDTENEDREIADRLKRGLAQVEVTLRGLTLCFSEPDRELIPIGDLTQIWQSRCSEAVPEDRVTWQLGAEDEGIVVDASMLVDLWMVWLLEMVGSGRSGVMVEVTASGGDILIEVRTAGAKPPLDQEEWREVVQKNGGTYHSELDEDGVSRIGCRFPKA